MTTPISSAAAESDSLRQAGLSCSPVGSRLLLSIAGALLCLAGCHGQQTSPSDPFLPFMRSRVPPPGTTAPSNVPLDPYYQNGAPGTTTPNVPAVVTPPVATPADAVPAPVDKYSPRGGFNLPQGSIDRSKVVDPKSYESKVGPTAIARRTLAAPSGGRSQVDTQLTSAKAGAAGTAAAALPDGIADETTIDAATAAFEEPAGAAGADERIWKADATAPQSIAADDQQMALRSDRKIASARSPLYSSPSRERLGEGRESPGEGPTSTEALFRSAASDDDYRQPANPSVVRILGPHEEADLAADEIDNEAGDERFIADSPNGERLRLTAGRPAASLTATAVEPQAEPSGQLAATPKPGLKFREIDPTADAAEDTTYDITEGVRQAAWTESPSENRLGEGDSPVLSRGLRKNGTVPGGSRIASESDAASAGPAVTAASAQATVSDDPYGHESSYKSLRGRLEYSAGARQWKLRYIPIDGTTDQFGGSVVLADSSRLEGFKPGDFVAVEGALAAASPGAGSFSPRFELSQIAPVR